MADIYRATDSVLGRDVAVKVLAAHQAEDGDIRARFLCEARAAARLSGEPNTVSVYDVGEVEGRPFFVMECLDGGTLADQINAGPVPADQALRWIEQAACALDAAHAQGVVHRDVKPTNLLLDRDGNVRVADFGIARTEGLDSHTQTGVVMGTAGYLAPEQAAGARATSAADNYSLAVVAHELLTGTRPHPGAPAAVAPEVFARALSDQPGERYESCLDFAFALRAALVGPPEPATVVVRPRRRTRTPAMIALAVALGLLGIVLAVGFSAQGGTSSPPPSTVIQTVTVPSRAAATPQQAAFVNTPSAPGRHGHKGKKKHDG